MQQITAGARGLGARVDALWAKFTNMPVRTNLNTGLLKIIAIVTMLIDHIGIVFFNSDIYWRSVGRISFPIFVYCVMVGCLYTRSVVRYATRLAVFAIVSQPFYVLAFHRNWLTAWNIYPTLIIGLLCVYLLKERKLALLLVLLVAASAMGPLNYGIRGVLLFLVFYIFRGNLIAFGVASLAYMLWWGYPGGSVTIAGVGFQIQSLSVLCLPFLLIPMRSQTKVNKYLFYAFYPAHLMAIAVIAWLLAR